MHQQLANATFRIECGGSSGSGFSFRHSSVIVTNYHVVRPHHTNGSKIEAVTEAKDRLALQLLQYSPADQNDFAILKVASPLPSGRTVLQPSTFTQIPRGLSVVFAGFPHGIHDLLVHEAIVSGPAASRGFYIDGSVNGGNSGGPIVDKATGEIIGIVTQRRFFGQQELEAMHQQAVQLSQYIQHISGQGGVAIMGIDFGQFGQLMAQSLIIVDQLMQLNANTGIGIGFNIAYVNTAYDQLQLP